MQQEVMLAMLAKEPSHGYQLRARLRDALGPLGDAMNAGQVYVTLTRLEKAGLLAVHPAGRRVRAGPLGRGAVVGGHRAPASGGPALARGVREELDPPKEWIVNESASPAADTPMLRARGLRKEYGKPARSPTVLALNSTDVDEQVTGPRWAARPTAPGRPCRR
jgi:hypothetical protein